MTKKALHPSVVKFKEFVKANPHVIQEVRKGQATWQELYEDWYLLGEEDSRWDSLRSGEAKQVSEDQTKKDWMSQILGVVKKMDANQVQHQMHNLNQALGAIQGVISQFQGGSKPNIGAGTSKPSQPQHPFLFRKD